MHVWARGKIIIKNPEFEAQDDRDIDNAEDLEDVEETIELDASELDWEVEIVDPDRDMGAERRHYASCDVAGKTVVWSIYEYPEGSESYRSTDTGGLELITNLAADLVHDEEEPEEEDVP